MNLYKKLMCAVLIVSLGLVTALQIHKFSAEAAWVITIIRSDTPNDNDNFGYASDISERYIIAGAPYFDNGADNDAGRVHLYNATGGGSWYDSPIASITGEGADEYFGTSVSIDDNFAVVSAPNNSDSASKAGKVYIYEFDYGTSTWNTTPVATMTGENSNDKFGTSVSIDDNFIIVGANNYDSGRGRAYIYEFDGGTWNTTPVAIMTGENPGDSFGTSVSIGGYAAVVGAPLANITAGQSYFYEYDSGVWNTTHTLTLNGEDDGHNYGSAVSTDGLFAVISSPGITSSTGRVSIYEFSGGAWGGAPVATINGENTGDHFGNSVGIDGNIAIVGAYGYDSGANTNAGKVYAYRYNPVTTTWNTTPDNDLDGMDAEDYLGWSVSVDGNNALAGAPYNDDGLMLTNDGIVIFLPGNDPCPNLTADFVDDNFESCVLTAIGGGATYIDACDAAALTSVSCNSSNVDSIAGAQYLTGVTHLNAIENNITNLSPLTGLTSLLSLGFDNNNNISILTPLANLNSLTHLWLSNASITDIGPLSGILTLERVVLQGNNISDISPLSGLTAIVNLYLNGNNITDLSPLTNLMNLHLIQLNGNNVSDLSVLANKTNLTELTLVNNAVSDISDLSNLTSMIRLLLTNNSITDPSPVSDMTNLTTLDLDNNNISDLTSIGTGNAVNMPGFADGPNNINVEDNPLCEPVDFTEITYLEGNGAIVAYDTLVCGDGNAATKCGEQCDDGNLIDGDGCSATCQGEYYGCYVTYTTPPTTINHSTCNSGCQTFGYAGGWSTDSNSCICYISNSATCDAVCTAVDGTYPGLLDECGFINCGNGVVEPDGVWPARETCDDGNTVSGDGCSSTCQIESGGGGGDDEPEETSEGTVIECTPLPTQLDIRDALISQQDGQSTVTLKWGQAGLRDINPNQKVEIFFDYLMQSPPAKIGSNNVRLQNVFSYHVYERASGNLKEDMNKKSGGSIEIDICNNDVAEDVLDIIKEMRNDTEMNSLIVGFIDDLLSLENTIIKSSDSAETHFTNYYYSLFRSNGSSAGTVKVVRKINDGGTYINEKSFEIDSNATSWTDTDIQASENSKMYKYQVITENCNQEKKGREIEVIIDPVIPEGTEVNVILDLKIKVKDAYDNLLMDKLRKLFTEDTYEFEYTRVCDEIENMLFDTANSEYALEYLITCFGEEDDALMNEIASREIFIVPPLIRLINQGLNESAIDIKIGLIIDGMKARMDIYNDAQAYAEDEQLPVGDFVNELDIDDLDTVQKGIMKLLGKDYFEGVSHASAIIIEKYDAENNLLESFVASTDIFGIVSVGISKFTSGDDYTLKIRLADEKFVLPKVVTMQINNAVKEVRTFGITYKADIDLEFDRSFRYGDFNEDGEINLKDIEAWGTILSGNTQINGYELWELWEFANLDGIEGINLFDVVKLQENWGGLKEFQIEESKIKLKELLELFGISITAGPTLDAMIKVSSWLHWVESICE